MADGKENYLEDLGVKGLIQSDKPLEVAKNTSYSLTKPIHALDMTPFSNN